MADKNFEKFVETKSAEIFRNNVSSDQALIFASAIAEHAFIEGASWASRRTDNPLITLGRTADEVKNRFGVKKWRTSERDSSGYEWQVRDGITWFRTKFNEGFIQHLPVASVLNAMASCKEFDRVAVLAAVAANPIIE